jgi:hypothetical protein
MQLTVQELMILHGLKVTAESMVKLERSEPYHFSLDDYSILTKVLEGFNKSQIKVRLRKPKMKREAIVHVCGPK